MRINDPRGVTINTLDSESSARRSNPREGFFCSRRTSLHQSSRQWVARIMHRTHRADIWPRHPMDMASAHGAGDCRFESCRGHLSAAVACCFASSPPLSRAGSRLALKKSDGEEESNPCMSPCPSCRSHVRAAAQLTPAVKDAGASVVREYLCTVLSKYNKRNFGKNWARDSHKTFSEKLTRPMRNICMNWTTFLCKHPGGTALYLQ